MVKSERGSSEIPSPTTIRSFNFLKRWPPEAHTFQQIKTLASAQLGENVTHAILVIPPNTPETQRGALRNAASLAGLHLLRFLSAPEATATAYGFTHTFREFNIVVVDLGEEALTVSVLNVDDGEFEVLYAAETRALGGNVFAERMAKWRVNDTEWGSWAFGWSSIAQALDSLKNVLSGNYKIFPVDTYLDLRTLSSVEFSLIAQDLVDNSMAEIKRALISTELDVSSFVLTGASDALPHLHAPMKSFFNKDPFALTQGSPAEAAARGAAILGAWISESRDIELEWHPWVNLPLAIGIETSGGLFEVVMPRITVLPNHGSHIFVVPDTQPTKIRLFEGERRLVRDNCFLDEFELPYLSPGSNITIVVETQQDNGLTMTVQDESGGTLHSLAIKACVLLTDRDHGWIDTITWTESALKRSKELRVYAENALERLIDPQELLPSLGDERLNEITKILNWTIAFGEEARLDEVDEKLGQARATMLNGRDGLPSLFISRES
ncbi:actin-like ATPase domain-containing protein [Ceratobasidium sp. AG-I]|nr:actin-like ATPase domain-containing protein [Ceratobasidium sp. AG-I]